MPDPSMPENTDDLTGGGDLTGAGESAGPAEDGESAEPVEGDAPVFLNRAARRTRGKGSVQRQQPPGKGKFSGGRDAVQGPRQYGSRRSG